MNTNGSNPSAPECREAVGSGMWIIITILAGIIVAAIALIFSFLLLN